MCVEDPKPYNYLVYQADVPTDIFWIVLGYYKSVLPFADLHQ